MEVSGSCRNLQETKRSPHVVQVIDVSEPRGGLLGHLGVASELFGNYSPEWPVTFEAPKRIPPDYWCYHCSSRKHFALRCRRSSRSYVGWLRTGSGRMKRKWILRTDPILAVVSKGDGGNQGSRPSLWSVVGQGLTPSGSSGITGHFRE